MCSSLVVLFLGLFALGFGSATVNPPFSAAVIAQVTQEQIYSNGFLDLSLRLKSATYGMQGGNLIAEMNLLKTNKIQTGDEKIKSKEYGFKVRLLGMFNAWYENKVSTFQTIIGSESTQLSYHINRLVYLQLQSLATQTPALYPVIYMRFYLSYLKTMEFAQKLQGLAKFRTWYEDEIDVYGAVVGKKPEADKVRERERPALLENQKHAFSAMYSLTQTQLMAFYVQYYLDYMSTSQAQPATVQPDMMLRFFQLYQTMYKFSAAQSGLYHVVQQEASMKHKSTDAKKSEQEEKLSYYLFASYGRNVAIAAQMDYMYVMYQMYFLFAGLQQQQTAQPATATTPTTTP